MRGKLLMRRTEEENKCIKKQEEKEETEVGKGGCSCYTTAHT